MIDHSIKQDLYHSFVELENLEIYDNGDKWVERARWIKFEEDVDVVNSQWCEPFVPAVSYKALSELKTCLENGAINMEFEASSLDDISTYITQTLLDKSLITLENSEKLLKILDAKHKHVRKKADPPILRQKWLSTFRPSKNFESSRNYLQSVELESASKEPTIIHQEESSSSIPSRKTRFVDITGKLPCDTEVTTILTAKLDYLDRSIAVFIRLKDALHFDNLNEVSRPVRFVCFIAGPVDELVCDYIEVGRCFGVLMSNPQFLTYAYVSEVSSDLLSCIDRFLEQSIVVPPGNWTKQNFDASTKRWDWLLHKKTNNNFNWKGKQERTFSSKPVDPLKPTGRVFGCLRNDVQRKLPFYLSDFTQIFDVNILAAILLIYLAALAPCVTFGGLLSENTNGVLGISEMILATGFSGIAFSLLAGQPLLIVGAAGPMVILESKIFELSGTLEVDFLSWRACIGLWVVLLCALFVAFDLCGLVRHITRFTEEIFVGLVSLMFIQKAVSYVAKMYRDYPIGKVHSSKEYIGTDHILNQTVAIENVTFHLIRYNRTATSMSEPGHSCHFLLTAIFIILTFGSSHVIRKIRTSSYFPLKVRQIISDFGVIIAVIFVVLLDFALNHDATKKLTIKKDAFARNWLVNPLGRDKSIGIGYVFLAAVPAFLVSIILFIETGVTAVILDKKDNKLSKGFGYHLDLLVVAVLTGMVSLFGLPWICASPVNSISHLHALAVHSSSQLPGTSPHIVKVKEQRVTNMVIHVLITSSLLLSPLIETISVPILYGVLLYLGFTLLTRMEFVHRLQLLFIPYKLHPDSRFVRNVKTHKIHIFTLIQLVCLILLAVVKETSVAVIFPFLILCIVLLRRGLRIFFTEEELEDLDGDEGEDEFGFLEEEHPAVHFPISY